MLPTVRQRALRLIAAARDDDVALAREVEARCHAASANAHEYGDHVRRAAFNLREASVGVDVVHAPDELLVDGTLAGRIAAEREAREDRFTRMLEEKYEAMNDQSFRAIVRCRRCGSTDVTWDEKQTRSADEAATVFCVCTMCKNRWVLR